jgi:hypothetical protein
MPDALSERYSGLLQGIYVCVDRAERAFSPWP